MRGKKQKFLVKNYYSFMDLKGGEKKIKIKSKVQLKQ